MPGEGVVERASRGAGLLSATFAYNDSGGGYGTNIALSEGPRLLELGPDLMAPLP